MKRHNQDRRGLGHDGGALRHRNNNEAAKLEDIRARIRESRFDSSRLRQHRAKLGTQIEDQFNDRQGRHSNSETENIVIEKPMKASLTDLTWRQRITLIPKIEMEKKLKVTNLVARLFLLPIFFGNFFIFQKGPLAFNLFCSAKTDTSAEKTYVWRPKKLAVCKVARELDSEAGERVCF